MEAKNKYKETPHLYAAWRNSDKVANILINKGAKIDAENKDKWTPLHIAALYNSDKVAWILINKGAKIHAENEDKSTPLHCRCSGITATRSPAS